MDKPEYSLKGPEKPDPIAEKSGLTKAVEATPIAENHEQLGEDAVPMGVNHFGIKGWEDMLLAPELDFNKTIDKVAYIEDFIKEKISSEKMNLDQKSYSQLIQELETQLGLSDSHEPKVRVNRIYNLMKLIEEQATEKSKKLSIINLLNSKY